MIHPVQKQYERFPYPPIPALALPRRNEGKRISFERGTGLCFHDARSHEGIRILVAGCGTLEALVVAQRHPLARSVTAVDFSEASIARLNSRIRWARIARFRSKLPPIETVVRDLFAFEGDSESFDYILVSNVIHHVDQPEALLAKLAGWLKPDGVMRLVTYPRTSRIWMRETSRYFRSLGVTSENIRKLAPRLISELSEDDPRRSCFESQPERRTQAGLVDAFLHECEKPLAPLQWKQACESAGLSLMAEDQNPTSQSAFLSELFPETQALSRWEKLQILDDLLELCANPVLWLKKWPPPKVPPKSTLPMTASEDDLELELAQALRRALAMLEPVGVSIDRLRSVLEKEVGPRVSAPPEQRILPGLSILDYDWAKLLSRF